MPTVGEMLREAREARNWTIDQIAQLTHVRMHYLQALEEDRRADLPSDVQARGYIRLYASALGLPAQPFLDAWAGVSSEPIQIPLKASDDELTGSDEPRLAIDETAGKTPDSQLPAWQQALQAIGVDLRTRREGLGITLAEVEQHTHIRARYLTALENGVLEELPSPVQGRGMLNGYAAFLNMDIDAIMLRYGDALQARREDALQAEAAPKKKRMQAKGEAEPVTKFGQFRRLLSPDMLAGAGLVVIVFLFILWGAGQVINASQLDATLTVAALEPTVTPTVLLPAIEGTPLATDVSTPAETETPVENGTPTPNALNPNAAIQVVINAYQRAFLKIIADNKEVFNGRTTPGNVYAFSASSQLELLTGNGAALAVTYNSQNLGVIGVQGQVIQMTFNLQGVITPTPLALPTTTAPATLTPKPSPTAPTPTVTPFVP